MEKKQVLLLSYTQTGQQNAILDHYLAPFRAHEQVELTVHQIEPETPYPFPWQLDKFLDVFPESHRQVPCELKPFPATLLSKKYDLILLSYQVWYLTPSIPVNSFMLSDAAKLLFKDTPVVTLVSCRNMWFMAQEKMKAHLNKLGAELVGHIALTDRAWNHISLVTILYWMQTGRKDAKWGIFPKPGVSQKDIESSSKFAHPIISSLLSGDFQDLQGKLVHLGAVPIRPMLIFVDKRGNFIFSKWSKIILSKGEAGATSRKPYIRLFYYYLSTALWLIAPIVAVLYYALYIPFYPLIAKEKRYFKSVQYNK